MSHVNLVGRIKTHANIQVIRNGEVIQSLENCGNMILDNFFTWWMNRFGPQSSTLGGYLKFGTSDVPTTPDMTGMQALLLPVTAGFNAYGSVDRNIGFTDIDVDGVMYRDRFITKRYEVPLGRFVGIIKELGICNDNSSTGLYTNATTHTRIVLPTPVEVTSQDQLIVDYVWTIRLPEDPVVSIVTADLDGVPTDIEVTMMRGLEKSPELYWDFNSYAGTTYSNLFGFSSSQVIAKGSSLASPYANADATYVKTNIPAEKAQTSNFLFDTTKGNTAAGVIGSVCQSGSPMWVFSFNPVIPKNTDQTFEFEVKFALDRL